MFGSTSRERMAYHSAKLNYETAHLIIQFLMRGKQGGGGGGGGLKSMQSN